MLAKQSTQKLVLLDPWETGWVERSLKRSNMLAMFGVAQQSMQELELLDPW